MREKVSRLGQRLGNYHLLRLLGEGGFAQVYLGEHVHLGTQAAIKVLHTRLARTDITEFRAEARTIAHLAHSHIVRVLEFDVEENTPFLVMDFAVNGTLRRRHPKGTILPIETILSYVEQISKALQYAHDKKVIHRDVKPGNMLLDQHQQVLLSDFGIAVAIQSSQDQDARSIAGTATYMSPEQLKGRPLPASDQYALGVVVYEWLCGSPPFRGSFTELCTQHMFASPPPLSEKVPSISSEIEQVVMRSLAKEPAQRFDNVATFASALQQASQVSLNHSVQPVQSAHANLSSVKPQEVPLERVSEEHTPPTELKEETSSTILSEQTSSPSKHFARRGVIIAGLGGLASLGIGLTWFLTSRQGQSSTPPSADVTLFSYEGHTDAVTVIAWSPDGKQIASGGSDKTVQIWDAAKGNLVLSYSEHTDAVSALAWSPDGKHIASGSHDDTVRVWDVAAGGHTFTYVYSGHGNDVEDVSWSPDGKRITVTGVRTMEVWNATDGSQLSVYQRGLGAARTVAWSPDGSSIASGGGITVYLWNALDGKQTLAYNEHTDRVDTVAWSPDGKRIASGGKDTVVHVWDAADGGNVVIYRGHTDYVNSVAWSPDGKHIVSGGNDETVQVWDAADGSPIFTYRENSSDVNAVAWSPDGKWIASGGDGGNVRVWKAP